jgi:hypothetical protein
MNGFDAEAVVASPQEAAEWLRANALRRYPASEFFKAVSSLGERPLADAKAKDNNTKCQFCR